MDAVQVGAEVAASAVAASVAGAAARGENLAGEVDTALLEAAAAD